MARIVPCNRCERGRIVWTGDEYQCLQCGWLVPESLILPPSRRVDTGTTTHRAA